MCHFILICDDDNALSETDEENNSEVKQVASIPDPLTVDVNGDDCVNVQDVLGVRSMLGRCSGCP